MAWRSCARSVCTSWLTSTWTRWPTLLGAIDCPEGGAPSAYRVTRTVPEPRVSKASLPTNRTLTSGEASTTAVPAVEYPTPAIWTAFPRCAARSTENEVDRTTCTPM